MVERGERIGRISMRAGKKKSTLDHAAIMKWLLRQVRPERMTGLKIKEFHSWEEEFEPGFHPLLYHTGYF